MDNDLHDFGQFVKHREDASRAFVSVTQDRSIRWQLTRHTDTLASEST